MRLNRRLTTTLLQKSVPRSCAPRSAAKNRIHHPGGEAMPRLFCEFHALIDGSVVGNAVEKSELENAEAESDQDFRIEPGIGMFQQRPRQLVQENLPAKHAQHQSRRQMTVRWRELVDLIGPQEIVSVVLAAFDSQKNAESGLARWRDGRHGAQPRCTSAASGFPCRNSMASRRFLPSSCTSSNSSQVLPAQQAKRR